MHLRLGRLSGIVPRALLASYDLACEQTPLEGSRLLIEDVPGPERIQVVAVFSSCPHEASSPRIRRGAKKRPQTKR